jgi:hypothetical protein
MGPGADSPLTILPYYPSPNPLSSRGDPPGRPCLALPHKAVAEKEIFRYNIKKYYS